MTPTFINWRHLQNKFRSFLKGPVWKFLLALQPTYLTFWSRQISFFHSLVLSRFRKMPWDVLSKMEFFEIADFSLCYELQNSLPRDSRNENATCLVRQARFLLSRINIPRHVAFYVLCGRVFGVFRQSSLDDFKAGRDWSLFGLNPWSFKGKFCWGRL
jgi:hypothetical protein